MISNLDATGAGRPQMVEGAWIKPGATVIEVGLNRTDSGLLAGLWRCGDDQWATNRRGVVAFVDDGRPACT